jgi:hypothetical protein
MLRAGGAWTTDLGSLAATHRMLGLAAPSDGLGAWEAPELVLVTAPRWLDVDCDAPANVLHAGPQGVAVRPRRPARADAEKPRVLLTFSTTVMDGQAALIDRVCDAAAGLDLDAVLTLGPAVDRDAVRVPDGVAVVGFRRLRLAHARHSGRDRSWRIGNGASCPRARRATAAAAARGRDPTPTGCVTRADPDRPAGAPGRPALPSSGRSRRSPHRRRRARPDRRRGPRTHRPQRVTALPPPNAPGLPPLSSRPPFDVRAAEYGRAAARLNSSGAWPSLLAGSAWPSGSRRDGRVSDWRTEVRLRSLPRLFASSWTRAVPSSPMRRLTSNRWRSDHEHPGQAGNEVAGDGRGPQAVARGPGWPRPRWIQASLKASGSG